MERIQNPRSYMYLHWVESFTYNFPLVISATLSWLCGECVISEAECMGLLPGRDCDAPQPPQSTAISFYACLFICCPQRALLWTLCWLALAPMAAQTESPLDPRGTMGSRYYEVTPRNGGTLKSLGNQKSNQVNEHPRLQGEHRRRATVHGIIQEPASQRQELHR